MKRQSLRLGIISDIHADIDALRQALDLLLRQRVHKIVCLGDIAEKGTDGNACIELLQRWQIISVRGNHDEIAQYNQSALDDDIRWHRLTPENLSYLQKLPLSRYDIRAGWRILMCHGTPTDNWSYLHPDYLPDKAFKTIATTHDADIILCGHSHRLMDVSYKGVRFLNAGSVCGTYTEGSRTCAILSLPDAKFQILDIPTN